MTEFESFAVELAGLAAEAALPWFRVERVILLADNDPEGRRAETRAREALARPGLAIDTEWPPGRMNDWAQLLKR